MYGSNNPLSTLSNMETFYRRDIDPGLDKDFTTKLAPSLKASTAADPDLRPYCTSTNQYSLSACAGNATADSVEILDAFDGKPHLELSRLFVYSKSRELHQELNKDQGTYISTCFEVLSRFGICEETEWPYDISKVFITPSLISLREATGHKIHSYYHISEEGNDRIAAVLTALRSNHPVVFGTQITQAFEQYTGGVLSVPTGDVIGGHAMIIVGWDSKVNAFIVKNSWGSTWGQGGFWYMSPDYLTWDNTWDLWVPTRGYAFGQKPDDQAIPIV